MRAPSSDTRKRDLAVIHVAKKQLGLDDDTYRDLLWSLGRVRSAADLDHAGRAAVIEHFRRTGFTRKPAAKHGRRPKTSDGRSFQMKKVEALLADAGRPWEYAAAMAKRMFNVDRLEWVTGQDLTKLIAALMYDQRRRKARAPDA